MNKLYLFLFIFFTTSLMKLYGQKVEISGDISGISDSTELRIDFLPLIFGEDVISKRVNPTNNKFSFTSDVNLSMWHLVRIDCNEFNKTAAPNICDYSIHLDIFFFVQPGDKIYVKAEKEKYGVNFQISGNSIGEQQNEFRKGIFELEQSYAELINRKYTSDDNSLDNEIKKLKEKMDSIDLSNIYKHLDWEYSAMMIQSYDNSIKQDVYNKFDKNVKESFFGEYLIKTYKLTVEK